MPSPRLRTTLLVVASLVSAAFGQQTALTLEQTVGRGERVDLSGSVQSWTWAEDGTHLVRGRGEEARWIDPRTLAESEPPKTSPKASETSAPSGDGAEKEPLDPLAKAFLALPGFDEASARRVARGGRQESADGHGVLLQSQGELYFVHDQRGARVLTKNTSPALELVQLSPDGEAVAAVQDNDLVLIDTRTGWTRPITSDGGEETFNGKLDWVYQEEVYGRGDFKAFWWSPDSRYVAFLRLDESKVYEFTLVDFILPDSFRVRPEVSNYPKVGDPNPTVAVGIADVKSGSVTWLDLSKYRADEPLVVRVCWTPTGNELFFQVQDRLQTWLDLDAADPATGAQRLVLHESSDSWVERLEDPRWLADGSFLWQSDRTGSKHIYRYRPDGKLLGAVTGGDWAVGDVLDLDEAAGRIWFTSTKDGAVDTNVYRSGLDGRGLVRLTQGPGAHSITFNEDKSLFLDRVSSLASPTEVRLCAGDGEVLHVLAHADIPDRAKYPCGDWELAEVRARDGFPLDAAVLKPVPFDPARRYPVWISTYSGPDSPSVRNRWNAGVWNQFLAEQGVIVLQVNVRTASGKGHWTTAQGYQQMGVVELRDLEDTIDWLCANPWADPARVGITGYSYGGFMTAFALTHSDKFALGIAGGGVYDWRMYDTIYTERYMSIPSKNAEGYQKTSVLEAAANLKGHLVLHHGTLDDNVHMQNVMRLVMALQKADKQFELMLYPQSRHGIGDRDQAWFAREMEWREIQEHLIEGRTETAPPPIAVPVATTAPEGSR
jgi:dipeptidyl-peptidase-4